MRGAIGERIFIHASQTYNQNDFESASDFIRKRGTPPPLRGDLQFGGVIGSAKIVDVVSDSRSPWYFGDYGLSLSDPRPCPFFPVKGVLNLFYVTPPEGIVP